MNKEQLLPPEVLKTLPPLYSTENEKDPIVRVKFFYPDFSWTWYVTEFDGEDTFFGLVYGFEKEWGYFTLSELLATRGQWGMEVERDLHFTPKPVSEIQRRH